MCTHIELTAEWRWLARGWAGHWRCAQHRRGHRGGVLALARGFCAAPGERGCGECEQQCRPCGPLLSTYRRHAAHPGPGLGAWATGPSWRLALGLGPGRRKHRTGAGRNCRAVVSGAAARLVPVRVPAGLCGMIVIFINGVMHGSYTQYHVQIGVTITLP